MKRLAALCLILCFSTAARAGSSSCDIGQYWYNVPGRLSWVSSGDAGVWGVNSSGSIFYRVGTYIQHPYYYGANGRNNGFSHDDGSSWLLVSGGLTQLDVGRNSVWGVNLSFQVLYRTNISSSNPTGNGWVAVTGLPAIHVSVGDIDGTVWAVTTNYLVYRRVGITDELPAGTSWKKVDGISSVRYVDIGAAGVWATTIDGFVYYRVGSREDSQGSGWQLVPDIKLKQVVSGGDAVWGVKASGDAFYRFNVIAAQPTGTEWIKVPGAFQELSVSSRNNALWGVNHGGLIYNRHQ